MKRLLILVALVLCAGVAHADPTIVVSLGKLDLNLPFTQVEGVALWDFRAKRGLAGAETPISTYHLGSGKELAFVGGAVTSVDGRGTPFFGAHLILDNPAANFVPLESFHPGLFVGRDFRDNAWMFGIKADVGLW